MLRWWEGVDSLCEFTLSGFNSLMILDKEHCRPFDASRAGLNLGEGAGFVVLPFGIFITQRIRKILLHTLCPFGRIC